MGWMGLQRHANAVHCSRYGTMAGKLHMHQPASWQVPALQGTYAQRAQLLRHQLTGAAVSGVARMALQVRAKFER